MPARPLRRRRVHDSDDEQEVEKGEEARSASLAASSSATSMSKRARLSTSQSGTLSPSPSARSHQQHQDVDTRTVSPAESSAVLPDSYRSDLGLDSEAVGQRTANGDGGAVRTLSADQHQPGSIVRVKLRDFVTYTAAEFLPGPSLNMIIGPNGTGKSTLVCAICLGLGWGPQHLGRAKDVAEYVKHGCHDSSIEIELAGNPAEKQPNHIVRRQIRREGNKSQFFINGKPVPQKAVLELARSLSIQIDNLCQFLPQDKVCEFAALTPVELLHSTQRAAAPPYMLKMHDDLKELRSKQKTVQADHAVDQETLANLDSRQDMLRADVERLRQRAEIQGRVLLLEKRRPFIGYRQSRSRWLGAKADKKTAQTSLKALEREVAPSLRAVNEKQEQCAQAEKDVKRRERALERADVAADGMLARQRELQEQIRDLQQEIQAEKNRDKDRREEEKRIQRSISNLERQMEEAPDDFDPAAYNERIREKQRTIRELQGTVSDLKGTQATLTRDGQEKNDRMLQCRRELDDMNSQTGLKTAKLRKVSSETAQAWDWVREHQDEFEHRVYGPPMIECSVKDPQYIDAIESLLQRNDFLTFTCQSRNDFKKLSDQLMTNMRLADVTLQCSTLSLAQQRSPVPEEQMRRYGFDGWALDFLNGPDAVLSMLCNSCKIHQTGVALRDLSSEQYDALQDCPVSSWVTGRASFQITRRREYGAAAMSTRVRDIRKAQYWTDQPVDVGARDGLQARIAKWQAELQDIQTKSREAQDEIDQCRQRATVVNGDKNALEAEKAEKQKAQSAFKALPTRIAQLKEKLTARKTAGAELKTRVLAIHDKIDQQTLDKAEAALEYANSVEKLQSLQQDLMRAELLCLEAKADLESLTERNQDVKDKLEQRRQEVSAIVKTAEEAAADAKRLLAECQRIQADPDHSEEDHSFVTNLPEDQTPESLEIEIQAEKARLELVHSGNPNAIAEFDNRQRTIDRLREKTNRSTEQLAQLSALMADVRSHWEPQLDALMSQISAAFSHSFDKIGCAGQVSVHKAADSDFDQWSIQIQVKFRENESLAVLNAHRQSGGERAVSTIFYLMALQSLARAPFRVVDEINQGMDPRNERLVHERMVDIACEEHTSQYFLITPKLLEGLKYHPRMRVHCIASGEYMPQEAEKVDIWKCVERRRAIEPAA
ncbi:MAG: hypothetical protein M1825_002395 [Sarcosagium campestre]|nr:MAG: hypothetical protein M1825_002395 [Sarcosagium campestre]